MVRGGGLIELKDYPKELVESRQSDEASFVFCVWKQPDLYFDYEKFNDGADETLKTEDGIFYFSLGKQLYRQGFQTFDHVTIYTYLADKPTVKEHFDALGGYKTVEDIRSLMNPENVDAYCDKIVKGNILLALYDKGFNVLLNMDKFNQMTAQEVYDYYDYLLNDIALKKSGDSQDEDLQIDDAFIERCNKGETRGLSYAKNCPLLDHLTLGAPLRNMYMVAGYSGVGKTSFTFENMILPMAESGINGIVLSNEQRSDDFKMLLTVHVLKQELGYSRITRKTMKTGGFDKEQREMLKKAQAIASEKYANIKFVKLYDNDISKVKKKVKKYARLGYQVVMFDTMKSEDEVDESMWQQLLLHSRKLFQLADRENIAFIPTYQLALHTLNKRYLDASCLSNAKQIKEVFSEMIYMRKLWDDEMPGERYDVKPFVWEKDPQGAYLRVKKPVDIDPSKYYIVAFLDKTRNDESGVQVLYEVDFRYNTWREVGLCTVTNLHQ